MTDVAQQVCVSGWVGLWVSVGVGWWVWVSAPHQLGIQTLELQVHTKLSISRSRTIALSFVLLHTSLGIPATVCLYKITTHKECCSPPDLCSLLIKLPFFRMSAKVPCIGQLMQTLSLWLPETHIRGNTLREVFCHILAPDQGVPYSVCAVYNTVL